MMTVKQVSELSHVSVRTLQYYDRIGLLKASDYSAAGYRLYDQNKLVRLQEILLYRELDFSLAEIQEILDAPNYDREAAIEQQIELLELRKERLQHLISYARNLYKIGVNNMDFSAFDQSKMEEYKQAAKEQWGESDAYQEYSRKSQGRSQESEYLLGQGLMAIFKEFGQILEQNPSQAPAQQLVQELQAYISEHYYQCSPEILRGLGQMYAAGGEFTDNIDAAAGVGTAVFVDQAIQYYVDQLA